MELLNYIQNIFKIDYTQPHIFNKLSLQAFKYQYENCTIYKQYINQLKIDIHTINNIEKIPFLPNKHSSYQLHYI
jgi:phenylacetate-coenzyme A ligase PaaK-like adenylate-forming protein